MSREPLSRERIAELRALAEETHGAIRGAHIFQIVNRGDAARTSFLTSPRDDVTTLHNVYWLEIQDAGSGRDMTNADAAALRNYIAACDPETILPLLAAAERVAALEGLLRRARENLRYTRRRHRNNALCWCARPVPQGERHSTHCEFVNELLCDIEAALRAENGGGEK